MLKMLKRKSNKEEDGNEGGELLLKLYRLTYECIGDASKQSQIKQEWQELVNSFKDITSKIDKAPETAKDILDIIPLFLPQSEAKEKGNKPPVPEEPEKKLEALCREGAVD